MFKKLTTVGLSGCLFLGLTACNAEDKSWIAEYKGDKVNVGVYTQYLMEGYQELYIKDLTGKLTLEPQTTEDEGDKNTDTKTDDKKVDEKSKDKKIGDSESNKKLEEKEKKISPLEKYVDGVTGSDWLTNQAKEKILKYIAIEHKFDELGLQLDKERTDYIERNLSEQWDAQNEQYGYEKKGVSKESVLKFVLCALKKQAIFDAYYGEGGTKEVKQEEIKKCLTDNYNKVQYFSFELHGLKDDEKAQKKELYNQFLEKAKSGQNFDDLIAEFKKKEYDDKESEVAQQNEDESVVIYKKETDREFSDAIQAEIDKSDFDQVVGFEDKDEYIVFVKKDPADSDDYIEENKSELLGEMKNDEFEDELKTWINSDDIKYNEEAIKTFSAQKLKLEKMFGR